MSQNLVDLASSKALTMSSKEIAELTSKEHFHVLRDIRAMLAEIHGEGRVSEFGDTVYRDNPSGGKPIPSTIFRLPKRETMVLVSGYSLKMRTAIVDRWLELEEAVKKETFKVPTNLRDALLLAADLEQKRLIAVEEKEKALEKVEELEEELIEAKPKVDFVNGYVTAKGSHGIRAVAKLLGIGERTFVGMLIQNKIMYHLGKALVPYAPYLDRGYFEVKTGVTEGGYSYTTAKFTPKGVEWITKYVNSK